MDLPECGMGQKIVRERCRYISSRNVWYWITYERPDPELGPDRCKMFPTVVKDQGEKLVAEYPDGTREVFVGFAELELRFSARLIDFVSDPC